MSEYLFAEAIGESYATEMVTALLFWSATLLVSVWALVNAARRTEKSFAAVGRKKGNWLLWIILTGLFCQPIGLIVAIYYLAMVRPAVGAADVPRF